MKKTLVQVVQETERGYFKDALDKADGDVSLVARKAAISLATAYRRIDQLDIALPKRPPVLPDKRVRIETLFPFFGVPCDRNQGGSNFWERHSGSLDAMAFDARKNYMAMVRKYHEAGVSPNAERLTRINALWQQLVETLRKHGVEI